MRLPIAVPPARHETVASYLARLASLHGLDPARAVAPGQQPAAGHPPARRRSRPAGRDHRPPG